MASISGAIPMFMEGYTIFSGGIALYMEGIAHEYNESLPMFINSASGALGTIPLYLETTPGTTGAYPYTHSLAIFVKRYPSAVIPLYCHTVGVPYNTGIPLFLAGIEGITADIPLVMPDVRASETESVPLFLTGY